MRLIIQLRPSSRGQSLLLELEHQVSPEALEQLEDENRRHVSACAEQVRTELPVGAILRPLPGPLVLLLECPDGKSYRIRENIRLACKDVEAIRDDVAIQLID